MSEPNRRQVLQVLGAGAAASGAVWTVPQVLSVPAAAAATGCTLPSLLPGCEGPGCPTAFPYPPASYTVPVGRDAAVNIFVGGDLRIGGGAAEAEGRVVVLGDLTQDKTAGSSVYNVGLVGAGSGVVPPNGSYFLIVGGDLAVAAGETLIVGGAAATGTTAYGGTLTGSVDVAPTFGGTLVADPSADTPYLGLPALIAKTSACWDALPTTGTATNVGFQTTFTGDGTSALQVFDVAFDLASGTFDQGIEFDQIPAGATVVVNMRGGPAQAIRTYGSASLTALRSRLVWNFTTATSVLLTGSAQFAGSVVVASPSSVTTVQLPGMNGRLYTAGDLVHDSRVAASGEEFHNYPFEGTLPSCPCT